MDAPRVRRIATGLAVATLALAYWHAQRMPRQSSGGRPAPAAQQAAAAARVRRDAPPRPSAPSRRGAVARSQPVYPVFPPDRNAGDVLAWLAGRARGGT